MKNKKLKLDVLKVQSFVTTLAIAEKQTLKEINAGIDVGSFACANSVGGDDVCQQYPSNAGPCGGTTQMQGGGFCMCIKIVPAPAPVGPNQIC